MLTILLAAAMLLSQQLEQSIQVAPAAVEEPCFTLKKFDRIDFSFNADQELDFNLHYHDEGVFFPADYPSITSHQGSYIASEERQYCLMWTNKQSSPVSLQYQYRIYTRDEDQ